MSPGQLTNPNCFRDYDTVNYLPTSLPTTSHISPQSLQFKVNIMAKDSTGSFEVQWNTELPTLDIHNCEDHLACRSLRP